MGQGTSREAYFQSINSLQNESVPIGSDIWNTILSQTAEDDTFMDTFQKLKKDRPENLATFIKKLIDQLVLVRGSQREKNTAGDFQLTNISLSYLSRILPIVFEDKDTDFHEKVFWLNDFPKPIVTNPTIVTDSVSTTETITTDSTSTTTTTTTTNINEENNGSTENKVDTDKQQEQQQQQQQETEKINQQQQEKDEKKSINETEIINNQIDTVPLAIKLMESLLDLLFFPSYTIAPQLGLKSPREEFPDSLPLNYVWIAGFGVETVPTTQTKQFWINRLAVLECLLACLSEQLYVAQENVHSFKSKWLDWFTETQDYYTEALLFSLINAFSTYDPIGWGIPYNHIMFADDHEAVSKLSVQILNILLTYDPEIENEIKSISTSTTSTTTTASSSSQSPHSSSSNINTTAALQHPNRYIRMIKSLKRARDFKFFFNSFERIMNLPLMANHTKLPNSTKKIELHQDFLVTFWRFISYNHDFLKFVVTYENSPEFIVPLLQYMDEGRKSVTTHGIVQIGTFILLLLSCERDFSISLNKPFTSRVYIDIPQPQVYSDFVLMVMYRLLVDTTERLESIYECVLSVLTNLSPYMKNLSMATCVKLMKLFEYLSTPRFLLANNHNYRYVGLLLESFNNILQHQYESNTRFIYAILRCQNQFSKLAYLKVINPVLKPAASVKLDSVSQPSPQTSAEQAFEQLNKLDIDEKVVAAAASPSQHEQNKGQQQPTTEHTPATVDNIGSSDGINLDAQQQSTPTKITPTIKAVSTTTPVDSPGFDQNASNVSNVEQPENIDIAGGGNSNDQIKSKKTQMIQQFLPTDEWLQTIKRQLPLDNILKVITHLSPQIQSLCSGSGSDEQKIMEFLKMSTIVGIFHNPTGPIITRRYHTNSTTKSWFIAYMWCIIYLENNQPPLFLHTDVKLFQVKR